ncbi:pseudouridine synthase, partial [Nadsonia fulvescens var. elongata DSM 6958]
MNGVFAIDKPTDKSSASCVGDLQALFTKSPIFRDHLDQVIAVNKSQNPKKFHRKKFQNPKVKIGHGGTLDPMATGVMVLGLGSGTKQLSNYLGNTVKVYEAVALLGSATTSYDSEGEVLVKTVNEEAHKSLTKEKIEAVVAKFSGKLKQTPPLYSALKMNGKPLYEYARSGEPLPKEIQPRDIEIKEIELLNVSWDHEYNHPKKEATEEQKLVSNSLNQLCKPEVRPEDVAASADPQTTIGKAEETDEHSVKKVKLSDGSSANIINVRDPIIHFRVTVSSGTYIRSLIHDIGLALGTTAHMTKLVRLRQSNWELGKNVFSYEDFFKHEEAYWGKALEKCLD